MQRVQFLLRADALAFASANLCREVAPASSNMGRWGHSSVPEHLIYVIIEREALKQASSFAAMSCNATMAFDSSSRRRLRYFPCWSFKLLLRHTAVQLVQPWRSCDFSICADQTIQQIFYINYVCLIFAIFIYIHVHI